MLELDHQESWALKNWCFQTVVLEKSPESPLDSKEIKPVNPKGNQSWIFIGRTDAEAEAPILWPPDAKSWLFGKDPDAGKDWRQEEKGTTEDEMVGWNHRLNKHGFGWTPGVGDGQGGLARCGSRDCKESDTTERLNWTELNVLYGSWGRNSLYRGKWFFQKITSWKNNLLHLSAWNTTLTVFSIDPDLDLGQHTNRGLVGNWMYPFVLLICFQIIGS